MPKPDLENIKRLRAVTGAGVSAAKDALEESGGDFDKAVEILRLKGEASAAKKSEREAREGAIISYVHGGRIGALVEVNCETDFVARTKEFQEFAKDIAMQVAASGPLYVDVSDVPREVVEKEIALYRTELAGQKKPEKIVEQIIKGKLDKYYEMVCLMRQPFIKDPAVTIQELTTKLVAKIGENVKVRRLTRFELGETDV